ncbi:MAG: AMP-binding protein [Elusimicrobia bacterium]|nr:AMP-binding protein [Elusimicrobiota bacterium]
MRLLERLRSHARRRPDSPALSCGGKTWSYAELLAAARRPAGPYVLHHGPKSLAAAAAWLGCLDAGVPFVPLDPSWPAARARKVRALLSRRGALKRGDAMLLFTSGSEGEPKGIPLSLRNIEYFLDWTARLLRIGPDERVPNLAPWGFDLSLLDVLGGWRAGAEVELFQAEAAYDPAGLAARLARGFTSVYATPSLLMHLQEKGRLAERLARGRLRRLVYAGESYPPAELRKLFRRGLPVYNFYGPTETNVCAFRRVRAGDLRAAAVPIGAPPEGTRLRVVRGELEVRGPGVMRGYLGGAPSRGVFRTRDRVAAGRGGLVFLGRSDRQVKHRGMRVEPGEIERALCRLPGVRRAVVRLDAGGFVAHLESSRAVTLGEAKARLARELPPHMSVRRLVLHPGGLPLTPRGKLDLRAVAEEASS